MIPIEPVVMTFMTVAIIAATPETAGSVKKSVRVFTSRLKL